MTPGTRVRLKPAELPRTFPATFACYREGTAVHQGKRGCWAVRWDHSGAVEEFAVGFLVEVAKGQE